MHNVDQRLRQMINCRLTWPESRPSSVAQEKPKTANQLIRSEVLLSLGIVLTELHFAKSLEHLQVAGKSVQDVDESIRNRSTAQRVLNDIDNEAGLSYGDVVPRCLGCFFDKHETSIENEEFQAWIIGQIVSPLIRKFRNFMGKNSA